MPSEYWTNRALRGLQRVARESVILSEQAPDEDDRFMALYYGLRRSREVVERLRFRAETDVEGRVESVAAAVRWWETNVGADARGGGAEAVRAANALMKEAVGVVGLASSEDPALWASARAWAGTHRATT